MTSISPSAGQFPPPSIQNAGQRPLPLGTLTRASTWPYLTEIFPAVWIRPDVQLLPFLRALMTRLPWPSVATLAVLLV